MLLQTLMMNSLLNWNNQWYPIAIQKFVDKSKPFKSVVLDVPIVTWYDKNINHWNTVIDRCPHRGAPLSEGRLENGNIECPYHGYQFNGCGDCKRIPQLKKSKENLLRKMNTEAKITTVSEDIIWIWMNSSSYPICDPPKYFDMYENDMSNIYMEDYMTTVPFDYKYLQENIMDVSHTAFTHHGTQSDRKYATSIDYDIISDISVEGFSLISKNYPDKEYTRTNIYIAPTYHVTSIKREILGISFNNTLVTYVLPISNGNSQVISRFIIEGIPNILKTMINMVPSWYKHLLVGEFVDDDIIMLNMMEKYNEKNGNYNIVSSSDYPVIMWNRWLNEYTNYSKLFLNNKNNVDLLNRYERHTKNCVVCLNGKSRLIFYRNMLYVSLILLLSYKKIILSLLILQLIINLSSTIDKFERGTYPPKRNKS